MGEQGRVVAVEANFCRVRLASGGPEGQHLLCTARARLAKGGLGICAGDWVEVEGIDWVQQRGAVARRAPRTNLLPRPAVANVGRVVVVVSLKEPEPDPMQITRFLVNAESLDLPVDLVLSKADTLPPGWLETWCERLEAWGYTPFPVSIQTGLGLETLALHLARPGISVLCGPSGVGKSSLLNALVPGLALRVAPVSGRLQRGRHTTRHVELVSLPGRPDAFLADTPGFNRPALPDRPADLARCFPELRALTHHPCRFADCLHSGESGCAIGNAWPRQALYRQCLVEVENNAAMVGLGRAGETALRQASRRRRHLQRQGDISPPGLED